MWLLYTQWAFRGIHPCEAWAGLEKPRWPARAEAVCKAFAIHAAELERTTPDLIDAIGSAAGGGD